ncbi:arsenic efflux protein [bacterium 210820-DFI.6.52]|nr:arsenic efflux protein [bacterium 210820-DFI.6.52]
MSALLETLFDILLDTAIDGIKMLPFLFGAYLLIEYMEHRAKNLHRALGGPFSAVGGALLGLVPQCGFSAAAANLYARGLITTGTLLAVFISTSDEAIPVLLANPGSLGLMGQLLLTKALLAVAVGLIADLFLRRGRRGEKPSAPAAHEEEHHHHHHGCGSCDAYRGRHPLLRAAAVHTLQIFAFVVGIMLALNLAIALIGTENLSRLLLQNSLWQPVLAAFIGAIPNCASSVLLTELYLSGSLTFGSVVAGLTTGAGLGLVVLFKQNHNKRQNALILAALLAIGIGAGIALQLLGY